MFRPGYIMPVKHPHNAEIIADELDLHVRDWCSVVLDFPSSKSLGLAAAARTLLTRITAITEREFERTIFFACHVPGHIFLSS
jgi:hypothetical protein